MSEQPDLESRVSTLEERVEQVADEAAAARHLAAASDRDLADLGAKVDANRSVIDALGEQTNARFDQLEQKMGDLEQRVDDGFSSVRATLDQAAAGQQQIAEMLRNLGGR